jgi:GTP-binding protein EngB required for normal cell division
MAENSCKSLREWVDEEKEGECRPCGIAALVGEYQNILEDKGHKELSDEMSRALLDDKDPVGAVASKMDEIKTKVDADLLKILSEKDCEAQQAVADERKADG